MARTQREKEAVNKVKKECGVERVLDTVEMRDCVEVVGKCGGDVVTFRVMNNGQIYER